MRAMARRTSSAALGLLAVLAGCKSSSEPVVQVQPPRIAFQSSRVAITNHVFIMNEDGTSVHQLADGAAGEDLSPALSPDGSRVAFSSNRSGHYGLYVVNADNTGLLPVLVDGYENTAPAWSPDGTKLAFSRSHNPGGPADIGISVVTISSGTPASLTTAPGDDEPAWSPDGTRIAFTRTGDVWVMDATGSNPLKLTTNAAAEGQAAWLPGGATIAFTSAASGQQQLMKMSATDGSGVALLVSSLTVPAAQAALSPDGAWVAYVATRLGSQQIYKRKVDGTGSEVPLTSAGAFNSHPSWREHP
jgi:Tol biopolymer transport system component